MRPYWAVLSARFRLLLQYRAAALAGFGTQLFWGLIRMMIFVAFYENATSGTPIRLDQVIAYVWLGQAFLAMCFIGTDRDVQALIRSGNVAYELLRPADLYAFWFSRALALRAAPTVLRAVPMLVLATAVGWIRWPAAPSVAAWAAAMVGALLLSSAITAFSTITLFWTIAGQGVSRLVLALSLIASGMIVPLPLFPDWLQPVLAAQPFRGLCDLPYRLFTGHIPASELPMVLANQLGWTVALVLAGRWLMSRAVGRLVVQGG